MEFGEWVRRQRQSRRMTLTECAQRAGMTHPALSRIESCLPRKKDGSAPQPTRRVVQAIAVALEVPISEALKAAGYAGPEIEPEEIELMRRLGYILTDLSPAQRKHVWNLLEQDAAKYRSLLSAA